jgi:hypothetical protein
VTAPFMTADEASRAGKETMANAPMGKRLEGSGRYKMPLLLGESGPKAGGDWVPGGLQSMTNLAAATSDTRALGVWELEQAAIGLGLHPELAAELRNRVYAAKDRGVDFQALKDEPDKILKGQLKDIIERAKDISGANEARDAGIVRHDIWEDHGKTGQQTGTEQINSEITALRGLLDGAGFEVIPDLIERTVRNTAIQAAGRFDNILLHRSSGRLIMADLKTKRKKFWTWLEIDAQLAGYANAEYMLMSPSSVYGRERWDEWYVDGPKRLGVDLIEGCVLHMPSDGARPRLRKVDLVSGWVTMQLARQVCTQRSFGRSVEREAESYWDS